MLKNLEAASLRRQILDWRDEWLEKIPVVLDKEFSSLMVLLNAQMDQISFKETFSVGKYAEKSIQPIYESWIKRTSQEVINLAHEDLESINRRFLEYDPDIERWVAPNTSSRNAAHLGIATGTAGAAVLGIPVVSALSTTSAGWGLGLLGVTVISWPVMLGGAAVLGTIAVFGGNKMARYREKSILDFKAAVEKELRSAVLGNKGPKPSLAVVLQNEIRKASSAYVKELKSD